MSLQTFCDIVWAEIWDDCPPMGDQSKYRDIMFRLIIKGESPHTITYKDAKGKIRRLAEPGEADLSRPLPKSQMDAARALAKQLVGSKEQVRVASTPDG